MRLTLFLLVAALPLGGQTRDSLVLLRPASVWDGVSDAPRSGWTVLVRGERIAAVGAAAEVGTPKGATVVELPGATLIPGMIEGHSHLFLHPYNETPWNDQVLREPLALRTARAVNHARATLMAGFTTVRDLGTEGAGYGDVGLKQAIEQGIIPGPRMVVTTRAMVVTGSYAPKRTDFSFDPPQGAEEADGLDGVVRVARDQIAHGADWIKVYADYRWGPRGETMPTFSEAELRAIVDAARSSGRPVVAHASTPEGIRRAIMAGVETIEHGRILMQLGCERAQGYGIARPMPGDVFVEWARNWCPPEEWQNLSHIAWHDTVYPMLIAETTHRSWVELLSQAIANDQPIPHQQLHDHHFCQFGQWLASEQTKGQPYTQLPAFLAIDAPHRRVHAIAQDIDRNWRAGNTAKAKAMLPELWAARDAVLSALRDLQVAVSTQRT